MLAKVFKKVSTGVLSNLLLSNCLSMLSAKIRMEAVENWRFLGADSIFVAGLWISSQVLPFELVRRARRSVRGTLGDFCARGPKR